MGGGAALVCWGRTGRARGLAKILPFPPHKLTFDLFHFVLEGHGAPPLGGASAVGGGLVIRHVVFQQHHVRP